MENTENKIQETQEDEELYSKKDFEEFRAQLENEFLEKKDQLKAELEQEAKKSSMSELELALAELEEVKQKYQEKEDECLIAQQKDEVSALLNEAGLDSSVLDLVYVPKDMEKTKEKIEMLRDFIENVKREAFQDSVDTPLPLTSNNAPYDAFVDGFDSNKL